MNSYASSEEIRPDPSAETVHLSGEMLALIEMLKDERCELRLKAATRLRDIGDERAIEPLCAALTDTNPDVRASAARALKKIGDARAVESLCNALKDSYRDTRICAEVLNHIGAIHSLPGMVLSHKALTPAQQLDTLRALSTNWSSFRVKLGRIGNIQTFCETCMDADVHPDVKRGAAAVLLEMRNRAVSNQLVRASNRADSLERTELLRGVAGCSDAHDPSELMRAAVSLSEQNVGKKQGILGKIFKKM